MRLCLTASQRHDIIQAYDLVIDLDFDYLLADHSDHDQQFRDTLSAKGTQAVIPSPKNTIAPHDYDE